MTIERCPITGDPEAVPVLRLERMPVLCNQLWPDAAVASAASTGEIDLVLNTKSGLLWNRKFDPARMEYEPGYENALHFSERFQAFAERLAAGLVARHGLAGRDVVEIGCGDGYFLDQMVKHGARTATGFDPSMAGKNSAYADRPGVAIEPEYFRSGQLDRSFDAVICRHVLEHIPDPLAFLADIRMAIGDRAVPVYFEVPNAEWQLRVVSIWDMIYEHVTYWTAPAMETLMRRTGFEPVSVQAVYGRQFLAVEAIPTVADPSWCPSHTGDVSAAAHTFAAAAESELARWRARLSSMHGQAVIWGAGSKGITFANALGTAASRSLAALVDLNPRKHGLFAPGVGLPVVASTTLREIAPEMVLIANALYVDEIGGLMAGLGVDAEIGVIAG